MTNRGGDRAMPASTAAVRPVSARLPGRPSRRDAPFALFVGGIFVYGAVFAWYLLDRFDVVNLVRDVNFDDSFYYFQIAYHMAGGEFSTFDGGLTRTNGYHPLWLFLITPFYWVFDKTEALSAIKAFEVMLVAGGVALVAGAARVARLPWVLLFAALPALYGNPVLFQGMEAAAALFMLGLFLLAVCLFARDPARWRWPLAAAAFALPWARLEYVAVAMAATAAAGLLEWSWRDGPERPSPGDRARAGVPFLAAAAGLLAYFAYNAAVFGGIVPVSGATKRWWSLRFWEQEGGYSLTENFRAFLRTGFFDDELLIALEVCIYAAVVWWFSRRTRGRDDRLLLAFLVGLFGLAAGHLAKLAQGMLAALAVHPQYGGYAWYFVPAYLMGALVVPARCYVAIWFVRRVLGPGLRRGSSLGIVAAGAVFLLATADFAAPFRFVEERRRMNAGEWGVAVYVGTTVMNRVLPEDSVVGSWDAGIVGYFSRFPVMNLDGLVNSWEYLRARQEGTEAAFRQQRRRLTHLANVQRSPMPGGRYEGPRFLLGEESYQFMVWSSGGRHGGGGGRTVPTCSGKGSSLISNARRTASGSWRTGGWRRRSPGTAHPTNWWYGPRDRPAGWKWSAPGRGRRSGSARAPSCCRPTPFLPCGRPRWRWAITWRIGSANAGRRSAPTSTCTSSGTAWST